MVFVRVVQTKTRQTLVSMHKPRLQTNESLKLCFWLILHLSLNREGRWGTTDDFTTSFLHFALFSTALWNLANSRPVRSLMLFSHLFFCLPCLLPPFSVSRRMVLARSDARETCLHHFSLRLFTMVRSSCGLISCWKKVKVIETHLNM